MVSKDAARRPQQHSALRAAISCASRAADEIPSRPSLARKWSPTPRYADEEPSGLVAFVTAGGSDRRHRPLPLGREACQARPPSETCGYLERMRLLWSQRQTAMRQRLRTAGRIPASVPDRDFMPRPRRDWRRWAGIVPSGRWVSIRACRAVLVASPPKYMTSRISRPAIAGNEKGAVPGPPFPIFAAPAAVRSGTET
jgi:hypothetical protein